MSGNSIPDIPRPRSGDPETQRFYDAVRQAFAAVQRTDSQALVTYEELGRRLLPLYDQYKNISDRVGGGKACEGASVPAAVSNIQTSGAFGVIALTWDAPMYRGHGSTEVWASTGTDVETAELIGTSETTYLEHAVPAIEFTTENEYEVSRNYWLRHKSACDKGYGPWSDMVTASTPASPTLIGELMAANADAMIQALGLDQDLAQIANEITSLDAGIHNLETVAAGLTRRVDTIVSKTDQNAAAIQSETTARTSADSALAQQINTVAIKTDQAYAAVRTKAEASTVVGLDGRLNTVQAKYAVQTDVNGYVQGFGLLNTGSPTTSGMAFNVNNFYVTNTVNGVKHHPFMIEGNKVYADNLFVRQANIEKLNVMDIATSGVIKSANYVAGSSGWKIDNAGNAEFNAINVRVPISNVTGQITKGNMQNVSGSLPYGRNGSVAWIIPGRLAVSPPVTGKKYSILAYASIAGTWGAKDKDMSVILHLSGQQIAGSAGAGAWGITVTTMGFFSGWSGNAELTLHLSGYNIDGTFTGQFGYIVFPE